MIPLMQRGALQRAVLPLLLLAGILGLALSLLVAQGALPDGQAQGTTATDMTRIDIESTPANLETLASLALTGSPAERPGFVTVDTTSEQRAQLDARSIAYNKLESFLLIEGRGLAGEASVTGSNGSDINVLGNQTIVSTANVSGAPAGKTVIRADVGVDLKYPQMCNIYIMVFHPSNTMWTHIWNGNQHACTADLNKTFSGIHDFDFADINGVWHMDVQETGGVTQGFLSYWFVRLYYQDDSTPTRTPTTTPTRTTTPAARKLYLPLILGDY